jgi:subtilase family serine protease
MEVPKHDVEAIAQTVMNTTVMSGEVVDISVVVTNDGNVLETFNLTCYVNGTEIGTERIIDLVPSELRTVLFQWNTTGVPLNGYSITAWADSAEEIIEANESNNWCTMPLNVLVVPEVPLGTILAFLSTILGLIGYVGLKRFRTK